MQKRLAEVRQAFSIVMFTIVHEGVAFTSIEEGKNDATTKYCK